MHGDKTAKSEAGQVSRMRSASATNYVAMTQVVGANGLNDSADASTTPHSLLAVFGVCGYHVEHSEGQAGQVKSLTYAFLSHARCSLIAVGVVRGRTLLLQRSTSPIIPPSMGVAA